MFSIYALSLALMAPGHPDQVLLHQPFVELLDWEVPEEYSLAGLKALRSEIEQERDAKLEEIKKTEEDWKRKLAAGRHELETLNKLSSADSEET